MKRLVRLLLSSLHAASESLRNAPTLSEVRECDGAVSDEFIKSIW
jgi:hypothetical protein